MNENIDPGPSATHTLLALGIASTLMLVLGVGFAIANSMWIGAALGSGYYAGRELAQSMRPSDPTRIKLTWANVRQAGWPTVILLILATILEWVY